jgi:hypothetical protein
MFGPFHRHSGRWADLSHLFEDDIENTPGEHKREMSHPGKHDLLSSREAAAGLWRDEIVLRCPHSDNRRRGGFRERGKPSRARLHLPGILSEPEVGDLCSVMPASKRDDFIDALAAIPLEISPSDKAAHAVRDKSQFQAAGLLKIGFDGVVELLRKLVDAGERRLQINRFDYKASRPQLRDHPPPQARIAPVAMHQQDRKLFRAPRAPLNGEELVRKWLDHAEQREEGKPFREDRSASREKPDALPRPVVAAARPADRESRQRKKKIDAKQHGKAKGCSRSKAQLSKPNQQVGADRHADRLNGQPPTKLARNHASPSSR